MIFNQSDLSGSSDGSLTVLSLDEVYDSNRLCVLYKPFISVSLTHPQAHLNTSFKHFIYFVTEFNLIEKRELTPMQELIDRMLK